jgi:hypothetical protein
MRRLRSQLQTVRLPHLGRNSPAFGHYRHLIRQLLEPELLGVLGLEPVQELQVPGWQA